MGRRAVRFVVVAAGAVIAVAASSAAAAWGAAPGGSVVSPSGDTVVAKGASYSIHVKWNATCPLPDGDQLKFHHWTVGMVVTRASGGSVNSDSRAYVGATDSGTNNEQGLIVNLDKSLPSETFNVTVTLSCNGTTSEIGHTSITITKGGCDPDLLEKSDRKYEIAKQFNEAGQDELKHAEEIASEQLKQYGVDKLTEEGLLKTLKAAAAHAAQTAGEWIVEASEVVGLVYELAKVDQAVTGELGPAVTEMRELQVAAEEDFRNAEAEAKKAKADLDKALAQGPCVGAVRDELNKLLHEAADEEKVRKLVDSWQAAGSQDLYIVNHELVNEDAAIKQARAIVHSARTTQTAAPRKLSRPKVLEALADMRRAVAHNKQAASRLTRLRGRDGDLHRRVAAVLG